MTDAITTTLAKIRAKSPCHPGYRKLCRSLGGVSKYGKDTPVTFRQIYESNGYDDTIWCLCAIDEKWGSLIRHFAIDCVEDVRYLLTDERSLNALRVARRFVDGEATDEELNDARTAARAAAWSAERAAAVTATMAGTAEAARATARATAMAAEMAAEIAAARDATMADARGAAWSAARTAAMVAARDAARAASWDAAVTATWAATRAAAMADAMVAARAAARTRQMERLFEYCRTGERVR